MAKPVRSAQSYQDIYLRPNFGILESRRFGNVTRNMGRGTFRLPVIPANMVTCIDEERAKWLSQAGYFYIMHRFMPSAFNIFEFCQSAETWQTVSISIGVQPTDYSLLAMLPRIRVDYLTVDIAHGDCAAMKRMLETIHRIYAEAKQRRPFIIAGNVATGGGAINLAKWGADAVKVGIGGGGGCSTKNKTGFHVPMWTSVREAKDSLESSVYSNTVLIADGGIREHGDIAKALVAGADWVMAGSLFAACIDSPAESVYQNNLVTGKEEVIAKKYFGSASAKNKGEKRHVEGIEVEIPCNDLLYSEKLLEIQEDLQSAVSYAGGTDLSAFKNVYAVNTQGIEIGS